MSPPEKDALSRRQVLLGLETSSIALTSVVAASGKLDKDPFGSDRASNVDEDGDPEGDGNTIHL